MRRLALATGLALLAAAAVIWGLPYLAHDRDYYATTPQPKPLVTATTVQLKPGQRSCLDRAVVDQYSEQARLLVYLAGQPPVPLELSLTGRGYRAAARVPATYADSSPIQVAVRPPARPVEVTICVRNAGTRSIALFASNDRTKSRSQNRVDGRPVEANFDVVFTERAPVSIATRLPVSLQRASAFRLFGVAPVTLWPLLILFAVGVPLAVLLTFVRTVPEVAEPAPIATAPLTLDGFAARIRALRRPLPGVLTSPWFWLGALMFAGLIAAVTYVLQFSEYTVMPDELGYMKQAVWFGQHLRPSTQGDPWFNSSAQLAPLLFAPAYGLFGTTTAFDLSHVISAVVFVSTAIPVFLLARLITRDDAAAVLAAALSIVVPWLGMTASLMQEPIAYPVFAWALLAMTHALERPSWKRDLIALLAIFVAALARAQLAILGPAFVVAALVFQIWPASASGGARPPWTTTLRAHWPLAVAAVAGAVALVLPGIRSSLLGTYTVPLTGDLLPTGTWVAAREVLAYVVVGVGGLPLALGAAWIVLTLARPASASARAFATVALTVGVLLVVTTGSFTVLYTSGITDRYLMFLVPVLVVASVAMLVDRRPATVAIAVAGLLTGALVVASDLAQDGPSLVTPSQTFFKVLDGRAAQLASAFGLRSVSMPLLVGGLIALAAVALAVARRRWPVRAFGLAVGAALLLANTVQTGYTLHSTAVTQAGASPDFIAGRNWLDRAAPGDQPVGAVLGTMIDPATTAAAWWDLDFWNKRIDRLYRLPGAAPDGQAFGSAVTLDPRSGRLPGLDDRALIVTTAQEKRLSLRGAQAVASRNGFVVWRAPRPYQAAWSLEAQNDLGDIGAGSSGTLRVFGDGHAGPRQVTLTVTPSPASPQGSTLRATAGGAPRSVSVPLQQTRVVRLPLTLPATGAASVRLDVVAPPGAGAPPAGLRIAGVTVGAT